MTSLAGQTRRSNEESSRRMRRLLGEQQRRREARQAALREFGGPAFARAQLANTAPQVGVRETRRVKGLYLLTEEDAKNGARFDDAIAWRSGFLDIGYVRYERMKVVVMR